MVPRNVTTATLVKKVSPTFPRGARQYAVSGVVTVALTVDEKGAVSAAHVLRTLPAPTLSYVAMEAMKQWRFKPATENGKPVKSRFMATINYKP